MDDTIATSAKLGRPAKWTTELIRKQASQFNSRTQFSNSCRQAYVAAQRKGILDEVCSHMPKYIRKKKKNIHSEYL